jgi:hypothetical protein
MMDVSMYATRGGLVAQSHTMHDGVCDRHAGVDAGDRGRALLRVEKETSSSILVLRAAASSNAIQLDSWPCRTKKDKSDRHGKASTTQLSGDI